jgi:CHAT domain-containing protein/Tfp pilus assembly protein PilF
MIQQRFELTKAVAARLVAAAGAWLIIATSIAAADQPFDVTVTAKSTPVMDGPKPIVEVQNGSRLTVIQTKGDWYLVDLPNANPHKQGWIRKRDVQTGSAAAIAAPSTPAQLTPEQKQERLQERDRLSMQADQHYIDGKFDEAIASVASKQAIEREMFGNDHPDTISSGYYLITLYRAKGDFAVARKLCAEELETRTKLVGKDHWQVTDARLAVEKTALYESLDTERRQQVVEADQLDVKIVTLERQGKYAEAVDLARRAAEIHLKILGENHPSYANNLDNEAQLFQDMGNYAKAEPLLKQVLEIRKQALGERHPQYGSSMNNLGSLYSALGDYAKAEPYYRQAAEIWKQSLGEKHRFYAIGLNNLAVLYEDMGDYAKAEPVYLQALEITKQAQGENNPEYASRLGNLGLFYVSMGDCAKAEPLLRQAVEIRKQVQGKKHPDYARSLNNLAGMYQETGKYTEAEPLFREALEIRKQVLGDKHLDVANSLENLASLYKDMGEFAKAEPLYRHANEIWRQMLGEKHPQYAYGLSSLANLYDNMGDYAKAEPLYQKTLEIQKAAQGEKRSYANSLNDLAMLYEHMGDYAKAEPLYEQSLEITKQKLGEKHLDYAIGLMNLAMLYKQRGNYTKAEPLYKQSLEITKQAVGEEHPDYALSLNNMAELYDQMGDYAKAEPLYKQSLDIQKQVLGEKHPAYALSLHNLAELYRVMGDYAQAEALFRQALQIEKDILGEKHPEYAGDLDDLALLYRTMGDCVKAEPLCHQALQISRESLDLSAAVQSERQQLRMSAEVRSFLDRYLSVATGAKTRAEDVYAEVLLWKGSVSARQQMIHQMHQALEGNAPPEVAKQYEELAEATRSLANLYQQIPKPDQREEHRHKLTQLSEQIEQLEQALAGANQEFRQQLEQQHRTPAEIRQVLPADATLVDLLEYDHYIPSVEKRKKATWERRLIAFIVRADQPIEMIELGAAEPINAAIAAWRKDFGLWRGETESPGQQLRRLVWEKIEPSLNSAKTVLLSPDGATAQLPWTALPGKLPGSFLIEETAIAIVPIPRMLPELLVDREPTHSVSKKTDETPSLLLVGNVNFGADPGTSTLASDDRGAAVGDQKPEWPSLPGTAAEVAAIRATFVSRYDKATPTELTQDQATKSAVRQQLSNYQYVHFSTHGFFAPSTVRSALGNLSPSDHSPGNELSSSRREVAGFNPGLLSGLVLAGANHLPQDGKDDGILTALEVSGLDLGHVQLATLSACETGLGESAGGEGLLGLQRAFQTAGAKTVVASLWKVPDKTTQMLMSRFYDNLWNRRMSKIESLREAQRWLLREGSKQADVGRGLDLSTGSDEETQPSGQLPPRYWAAFELSGDWR